MYTVKSAQSNLPDNCCVTCTGQRRDTGRTGHVLDGDAFMAGECAVIDAGMPACSAPSALPHPPWLATP